MQPVERFVDACRWCLLRDLRASAKRLRALLDVRQRSYLLVVQACYGRGWRRTGTQFSSKRTRRMSVSTLL